MTKLNKLPAYMEIFANKIYSCPKLSNVLDDSRVVKLRSLWSYNQIIKDMLRELTKNAPVLQIGLTFGDEITEVYEKIFRKGKFDIFDVSETQIKRAQTKYRHFNINIMNYNAAMSWDEKYDVVICYNLLHDLPPVTRQKVMDNALNSLTNGGKAIFIDCAKPFNFNPLKWPLFLFNRLYRPFAESLWNAPIESFCSQKDKFRWQHKYYWGHMFQKTVAVRKILSNEDVLKLTKIFQNENRKN